MVLAGVTLFLLVLVIAATVFIERATVDGLIAFNRDNAARAEALGRGGIQLAMALLLQDRIDEEEAQFRVDTRDDFWARVGGQTLEMPDGGTLRLRIEDSGARINLNALFEGEAIRHDSMEVFVTELLDKVIGELDPTSADAPYDAQELAQNLIDWIDTDDVRLRGGPEDAYYQEQDPAYRAANRPLLSFQELGLVEGFDTTLIEALRPYATVQPLVRGDGVNPNTAPSYVLATLYHGTSGDLRMANEDTVRDVLDIRARGGILCRDEANDERCTPIRDVVPGEIIPPPTWTSEVFRVTAEASYGSVQRTVEAVIDRSDVADVRILDWRVR